ncbi:DNA-3-methyladenine glycosylase [Fictibacillus nanhaiensis]|uniref:DNA-3-methyladenine glycosylase family protein n=1 Tax=Fictibacillus nanhaiensis TaxID=742169 RepID=UPI001C94D73D|nr:DNA-3-methyladenine glycosylase [Fictibacillus nanhaiensis]MBY6037676.1 DNA-3-methyladenine glycosylase [Fictibacillus nanhaiensis]
MQWRDQGTLIEIVPPKEFSFRECLVFLGRSNQEVLHRIQNQQLFKLVKIMNELILLKIGWKNHRMTIEFPMGEPTWLIKEEVVHYICNWFDLERDLSGFYEMASKDTVLQSLITKYDGLRIIGIPDLFEALTWAIMGQQINLSFAYTLKKRFVEHFGEKIDIEGDTFWLYPTFEAIALLEVDALRKLQFTTRKAEYVIGTARAIATGKLSKQLLIELDAELQQEVLVNIKGIGPWTAHYVMMKCLLTQSAFPMTDVGLHLALKAQLGLDVKPDLDEIKKMASNWSGWEAYATFYLWRSLYE